MSMDPAFVSDDANSFDSRGHSYASSDEEYGLGEVKSDVLFDSNVDDEDEAWVYMNLRAGEPEPHNLRVATASQSSNTNPNQDGGQRSHDPNPNPNPCSVLKPRDSDAVLSCPCCFTIVCMDCQRHDVYKQQFRAMFVQQLYIDWAKVGYIPPGKKQVVYRGESGLRSSAAAPDPQVSARPARKVDVSGAALDAYYPAHCQQCSTQVAVLNMTDEVYHFFDCLESA